MTEITMPRLSDSMEEGTILSWLKADGEQVEAGEELVEIETDKATVTYEAETAGTLTIVAAVGTSHPVGATIARVGDGAAPAVASSGGSAPADSGVEMKRAPVTCNGDGATRATPVARRVASHHGIDLATVAGSGPLGRITRADVLREAGLATEPAPAPAPAGGTRREPNRLQQVVARRMAESTSTIPHFQVQTEVVMDAAVALRAEIKAVTADGDPVPSFNDFVIKAAALALREHPLANGSYTDGGFELHADVNVGMAVAADEALVVPTVFDAASRSLGEIARETRRLAARVRSGEIAPAELSGGTFTVSNLGMFGMTAITPVINPPQAAILGVGTLREQLARVDGEIVDRTLLTLTLSCDHRILYGADAARFLSRIRELLEQPLRLLL